MELRPVLMIIGALTAALGVSMFLPAIADGLSGNSDWIVFVAAGLFTTLAGAGAWAASTGGARTLSTRQAFLLTAAIWIVLSFFGALPLFWSGLGLSFTDALFESVSGLTTTGATVITRLDTSPPGLLLWRGLLQWFGGLGIVVMAIAVLPMLQVGGMQMFRAEAFDTPEKILPRAAQIASGMTSIYLVLTGFCVASYWAAGMNLFDAAVHGMTTVATGGFSTRNGSIESYHSTAIDYIAVVFMILGSLPFLLYLQLIRGNPWSLLRDSQVRTFLAFLLVAAALIVGVQVLGAHHTGEEAVRHAIFSVTSVMTGTGYATIDYGSWGPFSVAVFFIITFMGGCASSTSCGIKTFRLQVLYI
ncbi:MAG TPA: TrkH family potassium uptake protein, partial [Devosiaceae bacterium]|nr:TrkH family potassium uptake protein [Devosiaceae bacterium]